MRNKKLLVAGAIVVFLLVGGIVFFVNRNNSQVQTLPTSQQASVPTISADSIELTLVPGSDKQRVIMQVTKTDGINSLDYELSYTAKGNIPRGAIGHIDIKNGQNVRQEMYLGTCSDVCHPDSDVTDIKVVVKVNKSDGKVYSAEATTSL